VLDEKEEEVLQKALIKIGKTSKIVKQWNIYI
jgi:hypothetical protein